MNTETYRNLRSLTGKCADEHFDCMRKWLAEQKDAAVGKRCRASALRYKRALEEELRYLKTRPQTAQIINRIDETVEFLQIIDRDLKFLSGH